VKLWGGQKVFGGLPKKKLKYENLNLLILVFSQYERTRKILKHQHHEY